MLSIIVAIAKNNVIGKDNKLIWHIPEDLKRFKKITTGNTIIMGRNTFSSLGRVLPNRKHVVLTRSNIKISDDPNVEMAHGIEDIKKYIEDGKEHFVIGGAAIYKLLMPYCNKMYVTQIDKEFTGDAYFPKIEKDEWEEIENIKGLKNQDNPYDYNYITYIRK